MRSATRTPRWSSPHQTRVTTTSRAGMSTRASSITSEAHLVEPPRPTRPPERGVPPDASPVDPSLASPVCSLLGHGAPYRVRQDLGPTARSARWQRRPIRWWGVGTTRARTAERTASRPELASETISSEPEHGLRLIRATDARGESVASETPEPRPAGGRRPLPPSPPDDIQTRSRGEASHGTVGIRRVCEARAPARAEHS